MNALSGRATYGRTTGKIYINGLPNNVANLSNLVGFVPQEDVIHRELTVRETLKSYALLRLPNYFPYMSVERVVSDVIEALQLDQVSDSIIGDEKTRGISGGQRKRVNIGMEMVADPSLLFLDEPTSGLDSTTTFAVVRALKCLSKKLVVRYKQQQHVRNERMLMESIVHPFCNRLVTTVARPMTRTQYSSVWRKKTNVSKLQKQHCRRNSRRKGREENRL